MTRVHIVVWVAMTFIVSVAGPFGTYEALSLGVRVSYWGGAIAASMVLALFLRVIWRIIVKGDPAWLEDLLVISSLAVIFGPAVAILNDVFWPENDSGLSWVTISAVTFAIGVVTVGARKLIQRDVANMGTSRRDLLLDRVGAPVGARLGRVSSDNHHIRVITVDRTEYRVLMRLGDAVKEIDVEPGMCVHRSHWVATQQIIKVERLQGREVLRLPCGTGIPIGPKYRHNLVKAGYLSA